MRIEIISIFLIMAGFRLGECVSFMELLHSLILAGRDGFYGNELAYPVIYNDVRKQPIIPDYVPFPCNMRSTRSSSIPDSVHRLRPGDIDVIGGLGDSLVAGSGALEEFAVGTFIEARGVSWCVGGQDNWRRFLTLPNILKVFNPNLTGYSTGTGEFISIRAKLNVAFPVAATEDSLHQAKILVRRIKSDPRTNARKQWKLVTILFGANDICSAQCYDPRQFSPMRHALYLRRTLDFLKVALPRTLVNLVPAIDVTVSIRVTRSAMCNILHPLYCACMHKGNRPDIAASKMSQLYQQAAEALIHSGRYDNSPEFTVVLQPFIKLFNAPNASPAEAPPIDSSLVTYDCFHFSQKGHALGVTVKENVMLTSEGFAMSFLHRNDGMNNTDIASSFGVFASFLSFLGANLLWNNMLQPVGNKTEKGLPKIFERVFCPTKDAPYIFTNVNSRSFWKTGRQEGVA